MMQSYVAVVLIGMGLILILICTESVLLSIKTRECRTYRIRYYESVVRFLYTFVLMCLCSYCYGREVSQSFTFLSIGTLGLLLIVISGILFLLGVLHQVMVARQSWIRCTHVKQDKHIVLICYLGGFILMAVSAVILVIHLM